MMGIPLWPNATDFNPVTNSFSTQPSAVQNTSQLETHSNTAGTQLNSGASQFQMGTYPSPVIQQQNLNNGQSAPETNIGTEWNTGHTPQFNPGPSIQLFNNNGFNPVNNQPVQQLNTGNNQAPVIQQQNLNNGQSAPETNIGTEWNTGHTSQSNIDSNPGPSVQLFNNKGFNPVSNDINFQQGVVPNSVPFRTNPSAVDTQLNAVNNQPGQQFPMGTYPSPVIQQLDLNNGQSATDLNTGSNTSQFNIGTNPVPSVQLFNTNGFNPVTNSVNLYPSAGPNIPHFDTNVPAGDLQLNPGTQISPTANQNPSSGTPAPRESMGDFLLKAWKNAYGTPTDQGSADTAASANSAISSGSSGSPTSDIGMEPMVPSVGISSSVDGGGQTRQEPTTGVQRNSAGPRAGCGENSGALGSRPNCSGSARLSLCKTSDNKLRFVYTCL
jgi:hypothetical protein